MNFIMIGLLLREALDRLRVPLNMYLVSFIHSFSFIYLIQAQRSVRRRTDRQTNFLFVLHVADIIWHYYDTLRQRLLIAWYRTRRPFSDSKLTCMMRVDILNTCCKLVSVDRMSLISSTHNL